MSFLLTACVAASLLALPALYTWVWLRPAHFLRTIGRSRDPCVTISSAVHAIKVVQAVLLALYVDWVGVYVLSTSGWLIGLALVLAGQHLNVRVYQLLGHDGVYYGSLFGKQILWTNRWPYSHLRDPQYVGCILTVLGAAVILLPTPMAAFWCLIYAYAAWLESTEHPEKEMRLLREEFGLGPRVTLDDDSIVN